MSDAPKQSAIVADLVANLPDNEVARKHGLSPAELEEFKNSDICGTMMDKAVTAAGVAYRDHMETGLRLRSKALGVLESRIDNSPEELTVNDTLSIAKYSDTIEDRDNLRRERDLVNMPAAGVYDSSSPHGIRVAARLIGTKRQHPVIDVKSVKDVDHAEVMPTPVEDQPHNPSTPPSITPTGDQP